MSSIQKSEKKSIGFMPKCLIQATLPHRDPKNTVFSRKNGKYVLSIYSRPGVSGLPYGIIPRLFFLYVATQCVQTKRREVSLGKSFNHFLKNIGLNYAGGKDSKRILEQLKRAAHCGFDLSFDGVSSWKLAGFIALDEAVFSKGEMVATVSEGFFLEITKNAVPVCFDSVAKLKNSSLSLDIYFWLTHRMSYLSRRSQITWKQLQDQFGSDYAKTKSGKQGFKKAFDKQMLKVLKLYSDAYVEKNADGILLYPSKSHVNKPVDK